MASVTSKSTGPRPVLALVHFLWARTQVSVGLHVLALSSPENRPAERSCSRQSFAVKEVLPQLDELLFSSADGVLVEPVVVTDAVVRVTASATAGHAACPGLREQRYSGYR
ncbi:hypothetical protein ACN6LL_007138 [Streptomyces violaceoruber]